MMMKMMLADWGSVEQQSTMHNFVVGGMQRGGGGGGSGGGGDGDVGESWRWRWRMGRGCDWGWVLSALAGSPTFSLSHVNQQAPRDRAVAIDNKRLSGRRGCIDSRAAAWAAWDGERAGVDRQGDYRAGDGRGRSKERRA